MQPETYFEVITSTGNILNAQQLEIFALQCRGIISLCGITRCPQITNVNTLVLLI